MYSQLDVWPCWVVFTFTFPSSCRVAITLTSTLTLLHFVFVTTSSSPVAGLYFLHSSTTCWAPSPPSFFVRLFQDPLSFELSLYFFPKYHRFIFVNLSAFVPALRVVFTALFSISELNSFGQNSRNTRKNWLAIRGIGLSHLAMR